MLRILTIVGARPQFIKASAMCRAFAARQGVEETLLHTGQHYDDNMSSHFFDELQLPHPRYHLVLAGASAEQMAEAICHTIRHEAYDAMLVYGDTTSTLGGALAAEAMGLPLFHIEAGLRSHNPAMPEEHNRIETDRRSALLFAPTGLAVQNLRSEGFDSSRVILSGDVMLDNLIHFTANLPSAPFASAEASPYLLATIHRNFNADAPTRMQAIVEGLRQAAQRQNAHVLLPIHPRVAHAIDMTALTDGDPRFHLLAPMGYMQTLAALRDATLVATDSGGLQKEAYFSGKPCVLFRAETEWAEIVDSGAATLADADSAAIAQQIATLWGKPIGRPTQFGDGHAAKHITDSIVGYFQG